MNKVLLILVGVAVVGALVVLLLLPPRGLDDAVIDDAVIGAVATEIPADDVAGGVHEVLDELAELAAVETEPEADEPATEPEIDVLLVGVVERVVDGRIADGEYPHQTNVSGVDVYWSNDAEQLSVGLVSPGTGYVAIGFDPEERMRGANYIIAFMQEGVLNIRDDFGTEPVAHAMDTNHGGYDNILASAGSEWPDETVVEFIIPLDSGDAYDKPLVPGVTYPILVSYHDLRDGFSARHSGRGAGEITLDEVQ